MEFITVVSMCIGQVCEYFAVPFLHVTMADCVAYSEQYADALERNFPKMAGQILCVEKQYVDPLLETNQIGIAATLDELQ